MPLGASLPFEIPQLRTLCLTLYPILIGLFGSLQTNFLSSSCIFDIIPLSDAGLVKNIFPICRFLFCPIYCILCITEAFQFYEIPFVYS